MCGRIELVRRLLTWLLTIDSPDEDVRRRGRTLAILAVALIVLIILLVPLVVLGTPTPGVFIILAVGAIAYLIVLALARRGHVTAGGWLIVAMLILGTFSALASSPQQFTSLYFLVLPLLVASLVLRAMQVWIVLAVILIGLGAIVVATPNALSQPTIQTTVFSGALLLGTVALLGFLSGRSTAGALAEAHTARVAAEAAAERLEQANVALEARVGERTAALQGALAEVENRAAAQARLLEENQQQREMIRDLSVPVLPVSTATLVMPLVGTLDSQRLALAQEQALGAIERARARYLALDITGVPLVDSQVAQGLIGVVRAARLLGTEVVLVGVRPEVAQALVGLGIDLRGIRTFSDLHSAIEGVVIGEER
jgi:rsbT co-antagonist protein RsbR